MVTKDYPDPPAGGVNVEIARGTNEYLNSQGWYAMRSLRLVVPATLVILSMSFAPAQAATGDDPGSGGLLGQLFRSLSSSPIDDPPIDTSDETDPPVETQPVDPPPPPKKKFTLPLTLPVDPPPDTDKAVTPPVDPEPTNPGNLLQVPETPTDIPEEEQTGELAANDDEYDVEQDSGATSLAVTSNDSGTITAVQAASMPTNGELDQTEMTSFSYTPNPGFVGTDSFTYQAKDANQATSNTATVTINVTSQSLSEEPIDDPSQSDREGNFNEEEDEGDDDGDGDGHRHKKHDDDDDEDDDDDDGDRRCHRHHHDHDDDHDHHGHHGDHDGDHDGDNGDNEWDEWKKDWNHDWDDDESHHDDDDDDDDKRCHRDKDDDDGDLPDTGSPVNLPLLALSGLLVIAGVAVVRRTRE